MKKIRIGLVGAAGYTGGELIRLLLNHPNAEIIFAHSKSSVGKKIYSIHQDLVGETNLIFTNKIQNTIDLLFLCLSHNESKKFLVENKIDERIRIIDLSQDFRLNSNSKFKKRNFVYGLPEANRIEIKKAKNIANPGCFATALQLSLLPLAKKEILTEIFATGITGSTGAGQAQTSTSHFSWRDNNIQAYKSLNHQHIFEVTETLKSLQRKNNFKINFIPWRGNFTRGIFLSIQFKSDKTIDEIKKLYKNFYKNEPFVIISDDEIFMKQVVNTNKCVIKIEGDGKIIVVHAAIDNLTKGASGQAIQNMNLMFGLNETSGLKIKASAF